jgi:class 3 adenylate cyclase
MARTLGDRWPAVVAAHHTLMAAAIAAHGGQVERTAGDSFFALFASTADAVAAAAEAQHRLGEYPWPADAGAVKARMGLHRGVVRRDEHGLTGLDIHLAARVEAAAHGGQVLMTRTIRDELDGSATVAALGEHRLKDFPLAESLYQLVYDDRGPDAFPPLRTDPVRPTNLGCGDAVARRSGRRRAACGRRATRWPAVAGHADGQRGLEQDPAGARRR